MRAENEHVAAPEQVDHGFDEGVGRRPRLPEQRRVGRFSDGIDTEERLRLQRRRFSEGVEQLPDTPPKSVERRFSEGLARSPTSD
jgi:hypothetical protein